MIARYRWLLLLGLVCIGMVSVSCGYRFVGGEPLPGGARRIFVPVAENRSAETGLETVVTNALRREVIRRGLEVSASRTEADAEVRIAIVQASGDTITRQSVVTALERQAVLSAAVIFSPTDGAQPRRMVVTTTETYPMSADRIATDRQRRLALEQAATRLAQKVLNNLSADF
jgi:hypothetical protein